MSLAYKVMFLFVTYSLNHLPSNVTLTGILYELCYYW